MNRLATSPGTNPALALLSGPVRAWFESAFAEGPTPAQALAWPAIVAGEHVLLVSPTGTGKTLAAFLAILDRLVRAHESATLAPGVRCVYVSPLRSLNYDIERNLSVPLEGIRARLDLRRSPVQVGVRTGDTSAHHRRKLRDQPPHVLVTTPESLSLLLSQSSWQPHWQESSTSSSTRFTPWHRPREEPIWRSHWSGWRHFLAAIRFASGCRRHAAPVMRRRRFLVGPSRTCRVVHAPPPAGTPPMEMKVQSLIRHDEAPHRGLSYRRLLRRLKMTIARTERR